MKHTCAPSGKVAAIQGLLPSTCGDMPSTYHTIQNTDHPLTTLPNLVQATLYAQMHLHSLHPRVPAYMSQRKKQNPRDPRACADPTAVWGRPSPNHPCKSKHLSFWLDTTEQRQGAQGPNQLLHSTRIRCVYEAEPLRCCSAMELSFAFFFPDPSLKDC